MTRLEAIQLEANFDDLWSLTVNFVLARHSGGNHRYPDSS